MENHSTRLTVQKLDRSALESYTCDLFATGCKEIERLQLESCISNERDPLHGRRYSTESSVSTCVEVFGTLLVEEFASRKRQAGLITSRSRRAQKRGSYS